MLVFIDESGDTGTKIDRGSSRYFVIVIVIFKNDAEALECEKIIQNIKVDWKFKASEIKFRSLNKERRIEFLEVVTKSSFKFFAVCIDKTSKINEIHAKSLSLLLQNVNEFVKDATLVIDGGGSKKSKRDLKTLIRKVAPENIRIVKIQESHRNDLLQLADMIAGCIHRSFELEASDYDVYRKLIKSKELGVLVWQ